MSFEALSKVQECIRKLMIKECWVIEVETWNQKANTDNTQALIIRCSTVSDYLDAEGFLYQHWIKNSTCSFYVPGKALHFVILYRCVTAWWNLGYKPHGNRSAYTNADYVTVSHITATPWRERRVKQVKFRITVTTRLRRSLLEQNGVLYDVTSCSLVQI